MSARRTATKPAPAFVDPTAFTPHFTWQSRGEARRRGRDNIYCERVLLSDAAGKFGTPTYLYSGAAISDAYRELHRGLQGVPHTLCFAVKSNGNLAILQRLAKLGSGFDIVSGGELYRLGQIGVPGKRIVFSGVGKTREEIREALKYRATKRSTAPGILLFNVESDAKRLYLAHKTSKHIRWRGISAHIGSQIVALDPFRDAFGHLATYVKELRGAGIDLQYLDIGGGLGTRYTNERVASRAKYRSEE